MAATLYIPKDFLEYRAKAKPESGRAQPTIYSRLCPGPVLLAGLQSTLNIPFSSGHSKPRVEARLAELGHGAWGHP